MSLFGELKTEGLEESTDRLGGFGPLETDVYTGPIKVAYAGASAGGARNVTFIVDHNGKEYRETIYVTNKAGENFFLNKDDKTKKVALPGFTIVDEICLATTGLSLSEQESEEKVVKIWDSEAKKELPKSVPVLTGLTGKVISLGIIKTLENKSAKVGDKYEATAETREVNSIDKVFNTETRLTVTEARNGVETAAFWDAWVKRNKGVTRDKRSIKDGVAGVAGRPGKGAPSGPPQASGAAPARKSLFGAKAS